MTQMKFQKDRRVMREIQAEQQELAERIMRGLPHDGKLEIQPGLFFNRVSIPNEPVYAVGEPSFCVIAQGGKEVILGETRFRYDAAHYLISTMELPLAGEVVEASPKTPEDLDASQAGFRVGYEDASHFSREYKRFFGAPPKRDIERIREETKA